MTSELVLLTGSSGHVGYATLIAVLKKGYRVRATVRSQDKADLVKSTASTQPYLSQLEFAEVKDITADGAFDQAVHGVSAVVHVASPLMNKYTHDAENQLIKPAVKGTTGILFSALKEKSVKRVVITSSLVAVSPFNGQVFTADTVVPVQPAPYADSFSAYIASKVSAHLAVKDFIEQENPQFKIWNVMPSFVVGANELAKTPEEIDSGSNQAFLSPILGRQNPQLPTSVVHLADVAFVHAAALDTKIEGHHNVGANYDYRSTFKWDDTLQLAKEQFPAAVKDGVLPLGGHNGDVPTPFDASETERLFDFKFKSPAEMVKSIVGQYVEAKQRAS